MRKVTILLFWVVAIMTMTVSISCARKGNCTCRTSQATEDDYEVVDTVAIDDDLLGDTVIHDDDTGDVYTGKSLNDIRFADFEDKDWLDNEYIRTLRKYLTDFNDGKIEDESMEPFRKKLAGKFVVIQSDPFMAGGLMVCVVFIDNPNDVFRAWIYSSVDEDAERVVDYEVRAVTLLDEKTELTKEQLLQAIDEHPELKLW